MTADTVKLSNLIAPAFYPVYYDVREGGHTYYDLYGGRGSCKSSFIGIMIPLEIMLDPKANAVCFRKVASTLSTSVFAQIIWGIEQLGVSHLWHCTVNPMKATYIPTGQVILFRGLDKAGKLKSIKVPRGYLKILWFEELDEYDGEEEIRSVQQSVLRGGSKFIVFKSFNPPISKSNWANEYVDTPKTDSLRHKSCYLDAPKEWLGERFLDDAADLKLTNPRAYLHEYMGEAIGTGGEVFTNLDIRRITDDELSHFDNIYMGIDWGWYPDPFVWMKMHFDHTRRILYIYDEFRALKMSNAETWNNLVMLKGVTGEDLITADSAEPKSVGDYRSYGSTCRQAIKGPDSRRYSYKWLQSLKSIVIDPERCPDAKREFLNAEYERTKDDKLTGRYPEENDHSIDAVRYAMERVYKRKGQ